MSSSPARDETLPPLSAAEAARVLEDLATLFPQDPARRGERVGMALREGLELDPLYRTLVEQIPAIVFMVYLDRAEGEAYLSPQIEEALGYSRGELLEDPARWFGRIHPADQQRWSLDAAEILRTGRPIRSAYRMIARDGSIVWFHCEASMIRREDGRPWVIQGVGLNITELKQAEEELARDRNLLSAVFDTADALVLVVNPAGAILQFNRACEEASGYTFAEMEGRYFWDLLPIPDEAALLKGVLGRLRAGHPISGIESDLATKNAGRRRISWSSTVLAEAGADEGRVITGIDVTERKRMEKTILEISGREQRKIGQDLHDGLGQHLTGIAFMSKVLERKLTLSGAPEAEAAGKIVELVNEAIHRTRELARSLLPVLSDADGLMSALDQWASEVCGLFRLPCHFRCPDPVLIRDVSMATHLYHIAQEAVSNAIKHASAEQVTISLLRNDGVGTLEVEDNGVGCGTTPPGHRGLGLRIMNYRASMIGGSLDLGPGPIGGTVVTCRFPLRD